MTKKYDFNDLVNIFKELRDPETGCPWDIKQTHKSITHHLIEESYELIDAINSNPTDIKEELGDILLQVMLHSQIAADENNFTIDDVIQTLSEKLVVRHPHVFSDLKVKDSDEVKRNWENIKKENKKSKLLDGVPKASPALLKADIIGRKVASVGFDWDRPEDIKEKINEEIQEFIESDSVANKEEEFGDLLFTLVQLARKEKLASEEILTKSCDKFTNRFNHMEDNSDKPLDELSKEELETLWQKAKNATV